MLDKDEAYIDKGMFTNCSHWSRWKQHTSFVQSVIMLRTVTSQKSGIDAHKVDYYIQVLEGMLVFRADIFGIVHCSGGLA